jgi:hypothetical protein
LISRYIKYSQSALVSSISIAKQTANIAKGHEKKISAIPDIPLGHQGSVQDEFSCGPIVGTSILSYNML